ncbi:hypothetical protein TWF696_002749 [Orbilia brochopaga]|uniref:Secreted protein n=1 Tax=Orbilia brochopaga TaxID=3140254 RepID=A0AAV9U4C8_9PEZI
MHRNVAAVFQFMCKVIAESSAVALRSFQHDPGGFWGTRRGFSLRSIERNADDQKKNISNKKGSIEEAPGRTIFKSSQQPCFPFPITKSRKYPSNRRLVMMMQSKLVWKRDLSLSGWNNSLTRGRGCSLV